MKFTTPCPRVIRPSKYEKNDPCHKDWWDELCRMLEEKYSIPADRKQEVIEKIFPDKLFERILNILHIPKEERTSFQAERIHEALVDESPRKTEQEFTSITSLEKVSESSQASVKKKSNKVGSNINNPYLQFFKRREERAAIWRPLPPLTLEEMSLTQKAEAITETIATNFVTWLKTLGGDEEPSLDVPTVKKMFEIGFHMHAATSLFIRVSEMPSVPQQVADKRNLPQASIRACLHRQLQRDLKASKERTRLFSFNTMLPKDLQNVPPKDEVTEKWLGFGRLKKELATMSAVWDGITHLRSTRGFCSWLIEHPEVPRPKYLDEMGMLDPSYKHHERHYSVETQDSFGPTIIPSGLAIDDGEQERKKTKSKETLPKEEELEEDTSESDVETPKVIPRKTF